MSLEFQPRIYITIMKKGDQMTDEKIHQLFINELAHVYVTCHDRYYTDCVKDELSFKKCEEIIDNFCKTQCVKLRYIIIDQWHKKFHKRIYTNKQHVKICCLYDTKYICFP